MGFASILFFLIGVWLVSILTKMNTAFDKLTNKINEGYGDLEILEVRKAIYKLRSPLVMIITVCVVGAIVCGIGWVG